MTLTVLALDRQQHKMLATALPMHRQPWQTLNENSTQLIWQNPCRGVYREEKAAYSNKNRENTQKKILREIQKNFNNLLRKIRHNKNRNIKINDVENVWSNYNQTYKFLPEQKKNIALRAYHHDMQIFLASFAYLRQAIEDSKYPAAEELILLEESALSALCSIEIAYNNTMKLAMNHKRPLKIIKPQVMSRKLRFRTLLNGNDKKEYVNSIDLKFAKFKFLRYLQQINKTIKKKYARKQQATRDGGDRHTNRGIKKTHALVAAKPGTQQESRSAAQKQQSPISNTNFKVVAENNTIKINNQFQLQRRTPRGNTAKRRKLPKKTFNI